MTGIIGKEVQGRKITEEVHKVEAADCPEKLYVARFDDGFYGVFVGENGEMRFFNAFPLNPQFTHLATCIEQIPKIIARPQSMSPFQVSIKVSPEYSLLFDLSPNTAPTTHQKWCMRGVELHMTASPRSEHPLDGANLESMNPEIFDAGAIRK